MLAYTRISYVIEHEKSSHVCIYTILKIDNALLPPIQHLFGTISAVSSRLASGVANQLLIAANLLLYLLISCQQCQVSAKQVLIAHVPKRKIVGKFFFFANKSISVTVLALARAALFPIRLGWRGWRASRYLSIRVPSYSCFLPWL